MKYLKKVIFVLILILISSFISKYNNIVGAEEIYKKETINYSKKISIQALEEKKIKLSKSFNIKRNQILSEINLNEINKYYYNQLTHDLAREIYNSIANGYRNEIIIPLNMEFDAQEATDEEIDNCFEENILPYIEDGYIAYIMDDASNYWWCQDINIDNITIGIANGKIIFDSMRIFSDVEEWVDSENFNSKLDQVSDSITGNNVYEIVTQINNYICDNVEYIMIEGTNAEQTCYGALMLNKAVCEGQTQLFNLLCRKKGIKSLNIYGLASQSSQTIGHAWNYVYEPTTKKWYGIDATWNGPLNGQNLFLMVGSNTVILNKTFAVSHLAGIKLYEGQTYIPETPELSENKFTEDISFIKRVQPRTIYADFSQTLIAGVVKENNSIIAETEKIKTGQELVVDEFKYDIRVLGDVNGDGESNLADLFSMNKHRLNKVILEGEYLKAGDINNDGSIDIADILEINKYRLGKINSF